MKVGNFLIKSLGVLILCGIIGWLYIALSGNTDSIPAIVVGVAIAFGNAMIGFALISWGYRRSYHKFLLSIYGGMIFRFLLIFILLFILIGALKVNRVALIISLVATYFLFLGLEILQIHKYSDKERV